MRGNSFNLSPDSLNDFFSTVAVSDEHQPATQYAPPCCNSSDSFHFTPIYPQQIQHLLQHLNNQKSTGPDGLSSRFLREVASEIVETLTKLYNISIQSGRVPLEWKQCNVTAVHKAGPQDDPSNYHPISVVSVIAKTLEKIVAS